MREELAEHLRTSMLTVVTRNRTLMLRSDFSHQSGEQPPIVRVVSHLRRGNT